MDQEQTQESTTHEPDAEEAAMQAAISEARGKESPATEPTSPEPEVKTGQESEPAAKPEPKLVSLTEEEANELKAKAGKVDGLESQLRTVHGRFGELNSRLKQIEQHQQPAKDAATASADVGELSRQYHEAVFEGDLEKASDLLVQIQSANHKPPEDVEGRITQALTEQAQKTEERLLRMKHPDFVKVLKSDDFSKWTQTMPEAERNELYSSEDGIYLAEKFDAFKEWRTQQSEKKPDNQPDPQAQQQGKQRLERAMNPSGDGSAAQPTVTEEDAIRAALRARRRPQTG